MPKVTVDNTIATQLDSVQADAQMGHAIRVKNRVTNTVSVFLGRTNAVTVSGGAQGYELEPGEVFNWTMQDTEHLWARAPSSVVIDVFEGGI